MSNLPLDEYLNSIKPHLRNMIIDLMRVMHSSSDNGKFTLYSNANNVIEKLFKSLHSNDRDNLETSMKEVVLFLI